MDCDLKKVGYRITELRKKHGNISQEELAKNLNVTRDVVAKWELGKRDLKTEYTVKLADFFGVSCDFILRGIESENVDIYKTTGLVQPAIEKLKTLNKAHLVDVLNYLLIYTPDIFKKIFHYSNVDVETSLDVKEKSGKYLYRVPWCDDIFDRYIINGDDLQNVFGLSILSELKKLSIVVTQHKEAFKEHHRDAFNKQHKNALDELDADKIDALFAKFVIEKWEELLNAKEK